MLGDRHETDRTLIEAVHESGEVEQGAAQPVNLIDQHAIDLAGGDLFEQLLQGGTLHIAPAETAIIKASFNHGPAHMLLALDVGFRCFPLRVERIELLL